MNIQANHHRHIQKNIALLRSKIRIVILILFFFIIMVVSLFTYKKEMLKKSDFRNRETRFIVNTSLYSDGISFFQIAVKKEQISSGAEQGRGQGIVFDAGTHNVLYIVTFQVRNNNAFPYRFNEFMIRVRGEDGREYGPLKDENTLFAYDLLPGEIRTGRLVFRLPQYVKKPVFAVRSKNRNRETTVELR